LNTAANDDNGQTGAASVCKAVLVLPRLRVQNANAISSPLTWGFPALSAFTGLITALERRLGPDAGISIYGVGVVCHGHEAQVTQGGYTRAFRLTRNPVLADGSTAGIVEEGRIHLDLTLVLDVEISTQRAGDAERQALADRVAHELAGMRLAGGSVMPALPGQRRPGRATLDLVPDLPEDQRKQFRQLARSWLPGFALVSRDDLLRKRLGELQATTPASTALDAWLDLSRWNHHAVQQPAKTADDPPTTAWETDQREGWIVPIPVGYAALSDLHPAGTVAGARDMATPFRFVESVWSMGQWIGPLRLQKLGDLFWSASHDADAGLYRCRNSYAGGNAATLYSAEPATPN
jgi:CRISPR-associated protein Csy2